MKLEIGNFYVKDIIFGLKTGYKNGILTVNKKEAIDALNPEGKLTNVDLHVARPGEKVRILPIKAVVEARARLDGRVTFPGFTGATAACGEGVLYALKNMSVMAVGKYGGRPEGMVDMSGPAAELTHYADIINLAFTAENVDPTENRGDITKTNLNYRIGAHLLAEYLGKTVLTQEPEAWERYELSDVSEKKLPRVVLITQHATSSRNPGEYNDMFYGVDARYLVPTLIHPNEMLDGCMCSSSVMPACSHNCTYSYQNYPMIKKLYSGHGKDIDFVGVIINCSFEETVEKKERAAIRVATIAKMLGCDAAIFSQLAGGHCDVELFTTIIKLEEAGSKTVGMCSENPGRDGATQSKTMLDARADAIVSTGSNAQAIELPPMDTVIGDLNSIGRDRYPGAWEYDYILGPSLRPDGSLIVDRRIILDNDGAPGWSNKTCKDF